MNLEAALQAARQGRLYPAVILHGGDGDARRRAAVELGRTLLCEAAPEARPCGACRHCRRIAWPAGGVVAAGAAAADISAAEAGRSGRLEAPFHADFQVLERDLKTSTSVDAARELMRVAQVSPFEARGQVFVIASAESLTGEAANALLKNLEEPHDRAPRHFLLLTPSRLDLLPTLRSRSLAIFLGPAVAADPERAQALARAFAAAADAYAATGAAVYLLSAAEALAAAGAPGAPPGAAGASGASGTAAGAGRRAVPGSGRASAGESAGWDDPRAGRPWALAAAAVLESVRSVGSVRSVRSVESVRSARSPQSPESSPVPEEEAGPLGGQSSPHQPPAPWRAARLALAEALLTGPDMRLRGISAERILEGLVSRHLSPLAAAAPAPRRPAPVRRA
ncbi:MAG TPA: hypothetical protein VHG32_00250 [Thermoanaerobaculia bacterium]|nr:hypothetical protein [Thermoanaerobaculia bacterium]